MITFLLAVGCLLVGFALGFVTISVIQFIDDLEENRRGNY